MSTRVFLIRVGGIRPEVSEKDATRMVRVALDDYGFDPVRVSRLGSTESNCPYKNSHGHWGTTHCTECGWDVR